ncbi:MAG: hypothetical protein UT55_C0061G0005 [Candidatus Peregrinibacteria bacterium GW2011_GWE2_39_6]|nr:MAG: hypothetical protein UT36_C0006G0035 [Candidatus Peregrinibacteria bacterium GW2011_GWF2_39_17]KKR24496.1 MAG: hypothetical protein UT55_C0061G0005 [Candidatus Peregrinibacteria bacterium GW2011_GWE2_39_6]
MTNRSSSKKHGMHGVNERRPKSSQSKRRNKAKARARRETAKAV